MLASNAPVAAPLQSAGKGAPLADMPSALVNAGFEQVGKGDEIPGWTEIQHAGPPAYTMRIDNDGAYAGHGSFHMIRTAANVYGSLTQTIDARKYAGKTVELSAMLKTRGVGPKGWCLFINANMPATIRNSDELSGDTNWQRASVQVKVPVEARLLTVGVTLRDAGEGWMDDVALKVVD